MTTLAPAKPVTFTLTVLETSDVHGAFFPFDFIERKPLRGSMARVSNYVKRMRKQGQVILLDNGDILQGQPTCYYSNYEKADAPNIAAEVINYLDYDAITVGNHDIETGHAVYDKWFREVNCPKLGANIIDTKSGKPYVEPYAIIERKGVRIAVLGMLSPAIPNWLHPRLWSGMYFDEMVSCARRWVKTLREKEEADLVIGLFHSGWEGGITTEHYDENAVRKIAEGIEGFDAIFFGHDHRTHRSTTANGTLCLNPANNAVNVAKATFRIALADGKATILQKKGEIVDITGEDTDDDYVHWFQPQMDSVRHYVERQIGTFLTPMRSRDAFFGSSAFVDYIHQLQLEHTGADLSLNAPLVFDTEIPAGPVYMSDMFKLYRYENQIYVLRMTGREVRQLLELSYDQWVNTMTTPDDHIMLLDDRTKDGQRYSVFRNLTFNFDSAAGIDYEVDVTQPDGQKVRILQFSDGRPFDENGWYRVAMNSYRGNGGGELLTRGAGIPMDSIQGRIEYMSPRDQRYYLTEKINREGEVVPCALNNWRFVPEAWAAPAIERDRKTIFKK